jgi:hypothetical protein
VSALKSNKAEHINFVTRNIHAYRPQIHVVISRQSSNDKTVIKCDSCHVPTSLATRETLCSQFEPEAVPVPYSNDVANKIPALNLHEFTFELHVFTQNKHQQNSQSNLRRHTRTAFRITVHLRSEAFRAYSAHVLIPCTNVSEENIGSIYRVFSLQQLSSSTQSASPVSY